LNPSETLLLETAPDRPLVVFIAPASHFYLPPRSPSLPSCRLAFEHKKPTLSPTP
jgi:hypothetical protein